MPKIVKSVTTSRSGEKLTRFSFRYVDLGGRRKYVSFALKRDAEAELDRVQQELKTGIHVAKADQATVKEVCDLFEVYSGVQARDGRIGRTSLKWKRDTIKNHIVPGLGGVAFNKLTYLQIERWHRELTEKGLSPHSAKAYLRLFKQIEDFARKRKLTSKSVATEVMGDLKGVAAAKISVFSQAQVQRLLTVASAGRPPLQTEHSYSVTKCTAHLAAICGLRFGEIMGLTLESLDFANRLIRVRHSLTCYQEHKGPKTKAGIRDVPMPRVVADMLERHVRFFYLANAKHFVFRTASNTAISASSFHRSYWRPLLRRTGLLDSPNDKGKTYHFHALRHFCASLMIEHGISMPDVAKMLGHAKFDTTLQVYAHSIMDEAQRPELIEAMTARLALPVFEPSPPLIDAPIVRQSTAPNH